MLLDSAIVTEVLIPEEELGLGVGPGVLIPSKVPDRVIALEVVIPAEELDSAFVLGLPIPVEKCGVGVGVRVLTLTEELNPCVVFKSLAREVVQNVLIFFVLETLANFVFLLV